jgi:hypothetical protein
LTLPNGLIFGMKPKNLHSRCGFVVEEANCASVMKRANMCGTEEVVVEPASRRHHESPQRHQHRCGEGDRDISGKAAIAAFYVDESKPYPEGPVDG